MAPDPAPGAAEPVEATGSPDAGPPAAKPPGRGLAVQTAIFSLLTGLSRVAGLIREVIATAYYATSGPMSAFTLAFQLPNLVRALFADSALSAAFVPVFTELREEGKRKEAFRLAGAMTGLILVVLGAVTLLMVLVSPWLIPLLTGGEFDARLDTLAILLTQMLFPIVVLLGINGLVVGILNAEDHFSIPALAPVIWNLVIIVFMVGLQGFLPADKEIYALAIGVLAGTAVQLAMSVWAFRKIGFSMRISFDWSDPRIKQVLLLMLPVTISLGLINFNMLINTALGTAISEGAAAAIDKAFRIYMLPQGMFSVAVATVLFPALSRLATRRDIGGLRGVLAGGNRQIALLLIPASAATLVLAEPITRLIYGYGKCDAACVDIIAEALFWFSFSLPFSGVNLLLTRAFFSLQDPWSPTRYAGISLGINVAVAFALYKPFGIAGIVIGTAVASAAMTVLQAVALRRDLSGLELGRTLRVCALVVVASAALGLVALGSWALLDDILGRDLIGQLVSVGVALTLGSVVYVALVLALRIPEAREIASLLTSRLPGRRGA